MDQLIKIRNKVLSVPILQGGMGVGVSLGGLAGAVAACGGLGCISTADIGFKEPDFRMKPFEANLRALAAEIKKAKEYAKEKGMVAINAMVATRQYADAVRHAVKCGVDAIISGAGLPLNLPEYVGDADVAIAPIVSSARATKVVLEYWKKHYGRSADFIVIEGHKAGGHLGYDEKELLAGECQSLETILTEVLDVKKTYEEYYGQDIPVFVAGGVFDHEDLNFFMEKGASGVQLATRFIATYECDASQEFKDIMIRAKEEDVRIIHSPVGMPGRALYTPLIRRLEKEGSIPIAQCAACIKSCKKMDSIYCITDALINAVNGNYEEGLFFCGSNVGRVDRMMHVSELIDELVG